MGISLAIIFHHLEINNMGKNKEQVKLEYHKFIHQQSSVGGTGNVDDFLSCSTYYYESVDKIDFFGNYLTDDEEKFAGKIMEFFYDDHEEICDKHINGYRKYLVINIKISVIHFGIYSA
ncbi:MAG: hypothetical protein K8S13_05185 [Desulfobacula sp.]|uniref:hypothetical protein n=1 Tax=Desulfobacula sp. TaxID=2593537 RepID=UPI0025BA0A3E|nr:hypothetical protein [Desulfobacula sp.]MCD4719241.1 hypothetical protein [Desulfobacula sp.]